MTNNAEVRRKDSLLRSFCSDLGPVEEEKMADGEVFKSPPDGQSFPVQNPSSPGSESTFEAIQRTPSPREIMKAKIKYHNMNPVQKYRARRRKPWKLIVQIVKIILITVQVCLFGLDRFSLVLFLENNSIALKHLFLKDYRNHKPVVVYEKQELYDHLHYAHSQYYQIQTVPLGNYDFTKTVNGSSVPEVLLCYRYYVGAPIDPAIQTSIYKFSFKVKEDCKYLPYPSDDIHIVKNDTFSFETLLQVHLLFSLKTVNLKNVKAWDKPACYQLNVEILFDNTQHDGKIPVSLNMNNTWLQCKGEIKGLNSIKTHFITVALVIFDAVVIFLCFTSLVLCLRSIYRSLLLAKESADFFKMEFAVNFTWSDYREFVSLWFFVIMISDCLTIIGSIYKMAIDQKDSDYYDICSIFLGCAVLLVWFGLLRFLGYFRKYNVLLVTLRAAAPNVARFCVCVSILFVGFMFCGWIILGPFHPKFKTLAVTAECLFSMVNGDDLFHSYALLSLAKTPILVWLFSKVYLYVFIALFIYVVLSLFIGIIGDTYERLKDMGHRPQTKIQKFLREPVNAGRGQRNQVSGRSPAAIQTPQTQAQRRNAWRTASGGTYADAIMNIVSIDSTGAE